MKDSLGREIDYIRISVTDRCNLRCVYCMPEEGVESLQHQDILRFEEIYKIVKASSKLGIKKVKITGGEPLVRKGVLNLVKDIKEIDGIENVTLTTNGVLLSQYKNELKESKLDGINISLDSLDKNKYKELTRRDNLVDVLNGIDICQELGIKTKINCVVMKGVNDNELCDIARIAKNKNIMVRFIEMMPIGMSKGKTILSNEDVFMRFEHEFGNMNIDKTKHGNGPAIYYKPDNFVGRIGFISAVSNCFCRDCNRVRLTADGYLKLCLQYDSGVDLKRAIRKGASVNDMERLLRETIYNKPKKHSFNDYVDKKHIECKTMSQIGG